MINEIEEFNSYINFPVYTSVNKFDNKYLGRFTYDTLLHQEGMQRIFTVIARGYMWEGDNPDYIRAYRALCAWSSLPEKKKAHPVQDGQSSVCFSELHGEFPELVGEDGSGWLWRHVQNILKFSKKKNSQISKPALKNCENLRKNFYEIWSNKLIQYQVPLYSVNTKASWGIRFDDIIADAKEKGKLKNNDFELSAEISEKLKALTPDSVPLNVLPELYKFYITGKTEESDWVVIPKSNFDAYFGTTSFSKKWWKLLTGNVIKSCDKYGIDKFIMNI